MLFAVITHKKKGLFAPSVHFRRNGFPGMPPGKAVRQPFLFSLIHSLGDILVYCLNTLAK